MILSLALTMFLFRLRLIKASHSKKEKELWERGLNPIQRFRINSRVIWRRFDTQTRGMGMIFLIMFAALIAINVIPLTLSKYIQQVESSHYQEQLQTACKNMTFYSMNFKTCEGIGARP